MRVLDLRSALRLWRRAPWLAAIVIGSLALGIGSATAIFSAVDAVLLHPIPYPDADRLTKIAYGNAAGGAIAQTFGTFREVAARTRAFDSLAVYKPWQPTLTGSGEPERIDGQRVSATYFQTLGVRPSIGTDFDSAHDRVDGPNDVIVSDALWRRRFNADPAVIGRQVALDGALFTVVGIMPSGFDSVLAPSAQLWALLQYDTTLPPNGPEWGHHLQMIGRLAAGRRLDDGRRDLDAIARMPMPEFPRQPQGSMARGLIVTALDAEVSRDIRPVLVAVTGAVLLLLTMACVNVVNILLAKGEQRRGDIATRVALGAGRARIAAQVLAEAALVAIGGGAMGIAVAEVGVRAVVALSPEGVPRLSAVGVNGGTFLFAFVVTAVVAIAVGIVPAVNATTGDVQSALQRASGRTTSGGRTIRQVLVVAEVAIALVLLVMTGLLLRSLDRLFSIAPGFDAAGVVTMQVQVASAGDISTRAGTHRFFTQVVERVGVTPGVSSAALAAALPLSGDDPANETYGVEVERRDAGRRDRVAAYRYAVTPSYFDTMRIPLRRGRLFTDADASSGARPVVISESFAARVFAGDDPIGRRLRFGGDSNRPWDVVVGVVGDVKQTSLGDADASAIYVDTSTWLWADRAMWLVVRSRSPNPAELIAPIKRAVWSVDRDQPIVRASTMTALVAASQAKRRFAFSVFEMFAVAALALAAIGIYGMLASTVAERTREIGIRTALGADRGRVVALIVSNGLTLAGIGVVLGTTAAAAASREIASLLFGVSRLDPVAYAGGITLLLSVAAVACYVPARRAARVDPAITLRAE